MKKIFLILFLIQNVLVLYAQYDDPYQYYPMAVGNYWYYSAGPDYYYSEKVYADSMDSAGIRFFWTSAKYPGDKPIYGISTNYFFIIKPTSVLNSEYYYKLDAEIGDNWWVWRGDPADTSTGTWCELTSIYDDIYLGVETRVKVYSFYIRIKDNNVYYDYWDHNELLAYGMGLVYRDNDAHYPSYLVGAIIDGKVIGNPVGIEENTAGYLPSNFELFQNYPNPFNPATTITYKIPEASHVELKVYDILGREILTLVDKFQQPGIYRSTFSIQHSSLASGVYYYTLISGSNILTKPMILIK